MDVIDVLSNSVILLFIIPFLLYLFTGNYIHIKAFLGTAGTTIISESIKYFIIGNASPRPKGAKNCNFLCNDGDQSDRPGMPSGHSSEVAFFSGFYYQQTTNPLIRSFLVVYAGLVMLSRYIKHCHTINQIVAGAILGMSFSWLAVRHL